MTEEITKYLHRHGYDTWEPRAALFDMDGILYDSMPNHAIAWHNAMRQYGISMSCEEAYTYEGMRGVETIRLIVKRQLGKDITEEELHTKLNGVPNNRIIQYFMNGKATSDDLNHYSLLNSQSLYIILYMLQILYLYLQLYLHLLM